MEKGRLMELLGMKQMVDSAIPLEWSRAARGLGVSKPDFWYVWSYLQNGTYNKPVHLGESFFQLLDETKITVNGDNHCASILDLVETLLAHPEDVKITIR